MTADLPAWFFPAAALAYVLAGGLLSLILMVLSPNDRRAAVNDPLIAGVLVFCWPLMFFFLLLGMLCFFLGCLVCPLLRLFFPSN